MSAEWPEWLTPEYRAIHTAITNAMVNALDHCYAAADATGYEGGGWTMDGLFSVAASSIMDLFKQGGCPPPSVVPAERASAADVARMWAWDDEGDDE